MKNLQDYCITLETARRLYEAGVTDSNSIWRWRLAGNLGYQIERASGLIVKRNTFPALTLQELMELGPFKIIQVNFRGVDGWSASCDGVDHGFGDPNPLRALEALTIYLLDNDLWPNLTK